MAIMIGGKPNTAPTPTSNQEVSPKGETSNANEKDEVKKKSNKRK